MKFVIITLFCLLLFGCSNDPNKMNGKYVKSVDGKIFKVEARMVDTYLLTEVDMKSIEEILRMKETVE